MVEMPKKPNISNEEIESLIMNRKRKTSVSESEPDSCDTTRDSIKAPANPGQKRKPRDAKPTRPVEHTAPPVVPTEVPVPPQTAPAEGIRPEQMSAVVYADHITEVAESLPNGLKKMRLYEARGLLLALVGIDESAIYMHNPQYDQGIEGERGYSPSYYNAREEPDNYGADPSEVIANAGKYGDACDGCGDETSTQDEASGDLVDDETYDDEEGGDWDEE